MRGAYAGVLGQDIQRSDMQLEFFGLGKFSEADSKGDQLFALNICGAAHYPLSNMVPDGI